MDGRPPSTAAHRIDGPDSPAGVVGSDYADAFEVAITKPDERSAEQWARAVFEGAPAFVRLFLLAGWRAVLGLRLGPRQSPDHVLGWRIVSAEAEMIRLELQSTLMTAGLVFRLNGSTAVMTTHVRYTRAMARPLWALVGPLHRLIVPHLFGRAAGLPLNALGPAV